MINDFRNWSEAPYILIGKAALILLDHGEAVTVDAIKDLLTTLDQKEDADLLARTLHHLDHRTSSVD